MKEKKIVVSFATRETTNNFIAYMSPHKCRCKEAISHSIEMKCRDGVVSSSKSSCDNIHSKSEEASDGDKNANFA